MVPAILREGERPLGYAGQQSATFSKGGAGVVSQFCWLFAGAISKFRAMPGTHPKDTRLGPGGSGSINILAANRLILLAAIPLFLVLAVVIYIAIQFAANEREAQALVRHTYQVMETLRLIEDDMQSSESSMRGYLLDRDPAFLNSYHNRSRRVPGDLRDFRSLSTDNPSQQRRADRLTALTGARLQGLANAERAAGRGAMGTSSPIVVQAITRERQQMAGIRAEVTAGLSEEQTLLTRRDAVRRQQEGLEVAFAVGAGVLTLGILLIAAAMLVRNNVSLDLSERARANEAAILQATLDTVRDGVAYFTSDGLLCAFNAGFFQLLDLPDSLARKSVTRLAHLQAAAKEQTILSPPDTGQGPLEARHMVWGGRELDVYKAFVATGGFLIGLSDVTARMRAEGMVRQSQKMEAIGQLTGGVAHDFNNLLQIISANLDLAVSSDEAKNNSRLGQRLQNAMGAVSRGSRLTGQLLAFARRQALDPRSVDLGRVIRDMADLLRRTLGENIQVESVIAGGLWNTLIDPTQLENAILNLAINARDAMPEGGKLTLEVANAHLDDAYAAQYSDVNPGQYVMLAVSDTGAGMTPDIMARVFEPFFTTKPEGKGTGLGLAQAYGFVKQSGGHIKIYSEVGEGTTVKLYLPRTRRAQDAADVISSLPIEGGSERILVVEDDEGVRAAVVDMLTALGYAVQRAENAEAALRLLESGAKVDLLFTDVVMPGAISTREFTRRAQAMFPNLLVLYTSGYTQNAIVHNGKLDDDAFLLSKPYRKDELARKLRSVFAGTARGPISPPAGVPDMVAAERRGKVLVVEDVLLIRMATVDMVEQIGFSATEAGDGAEALVQLQKDPTIEILLTDLGLPGMNGRQLVQEALRLKPSLKVIIASGYSTEDATGEPQVRGLVHLTKPFDLSQLRRALGV
jgi:signal transduction histidine kinase/CheY-like chemotaxis protein